jgi:hypothetical protein
VPVYRQNPRTAGRVLAGQAFIVTPDDHKLHTLNLAAAAIWERAATGCTPDEAAAELVQRFEVDFDRALQDATACVADLVRRRILVSE